jgi:alpha-amylase
VRFSALQLPPASKAQGGVADTCDGYGVFDPRDLGNKLQQGSRPTRYGSVESLRRLIACCHAVGIDAYLDVVLHQRSGENGGPGVFNYLDAEGHSLSGRGPMRAGCFRGVPPANRPEDAVPVPASDFEFGREKVYQNCDPAGYTIHDALDYGDWLFRTTDADGMRFDDTKGTWAPFVATFMRTGPMAKKFAYSEYFDGDPNNLNWWATSPPMSSRSLVEDFTLHWALQTACDQGNAEVLNGAGYAARNPFLSCTWVDNPDTDTSPGQGVISSKLLAYAFILSTEGYPFVYAKDYYPASVWPGAYGLKPWIDNLIWIHEVLASGTTVTQYLDPKVIVLNRTGDPGLLTAMNFDTWNPRTIECSTTFGPNVQLHDYTGRHPDIWTDWEGCASFTIPSNVDRNGQSYLCFSRAGIDQPIDVNRRTTTQVFFGAPDLDIPPARNGQSMVGRIWCLDQSTISVTFLPSAEDRLWQSKAQITLEVVGLSGDQAHPLGWKEIKEFIECAGEGLRADRERAMLCVAYETLARRGELVALEIKDIDFRPDGTGQALIRRGKTDADGQGRMACLSRETVRWLKVWLEHAGISDGSLFRRLVGQHQIGGPLNPGSIAPIFKRVAHWIGLPARVVNHVSGHSTRVGATQDLAALDIDLAAITQAGGWKSTRMPLQYSEKIATARSAMARVAISTGRD